MNKLTRGEMLQQELDAFIDEVQRTTEQAEALRSFVDQNLIERHAAAEELELMAARLIKRSRTLGSMIEDFAGSPEHDPDFAERAMKMAANTKQELQRFYREVMHSDADELKLDREFGDG